MRLDLARHDHHAPRPARPRARLAGCGGSATSTTGAVRNGGRTLVIDRGKTDAAARRLALPPVIQPLVLARTLGRSPEDYLFPLCRGDGALIVAVERICRAAGLPRIVPYALRGTHASLAVEEGATRAIVAKALGHTSAVMTESHSIRPGLVSETRRAQAQAELLGPETFSNIPFPAAARSRNG